MPTGIGTSQAASQRVALALPAATANATSAALNLGAQGGRGQGSLKLQLTTPAQAVGNLANAQTLTLEIQDCDTEAGAYVAVPGYGTMVVTGAGGVGAAITSFLLRLHDHVRQFVKCKVTTSAGAGAPTGSLTFETIYQG